MNREKIITSFRHEKSVKILFYVDEIRGKE